MSGTLERRDPWLGIELRHLAALSAIESEGTFSDAALALGYVQSAISGQVATLERLTGTCLVERSRAAGPQQLTPAGQLLLTHFAEILEELESARQRLEMARNQESGSFRIGVEDGLAGDIVTGVISAVAADPQGPTVASIETLDREALVGRLVQEELDVALIEVPVTVDGVAVAEITRDPLVLLVPAGSRLPRRHVPASADDLAKQPIIVWCEGDDPSRVERELEELGVRADVLVRTSEPFSAQQLVADGVGAAILPRGVVRPDRRIAVCELDAGLPPRAIGIAWRRDRSRDQRLRRVIDVGCRLRPDDVADTALDETPEPVGSRLFERRREATSARRAP